MENQGSPDICGKKHSTLTTNNLKETDKTTHKKKKKEENNLENANLYPRRN